MIIMISVSILILLLILFAIWRLTPHKTDIFNIERITFNDGRSICVIKRRAKLFWIGPYVQEYYQEIYDGNYMSHTSYTWFRWFGEEFETLDSAKKQYNILVNKSKLEIINVEEVSRL